MNTITSTTTTTTYTVVEALFSHGFEVETTVTNNSGVAIRRDYLRNLRGVIRVFSSRNGARKAITRQLRKIAGEPGALHR